MLVKLYYLTAALVSSALAVPLAADADAGAPAPGLSKRFAGGSCGVHVSQELGVNSWYNEFTVNVKDGTGASLGDDCQTYSINTDVPDEDIHPTAGTLQCQRGDLPWPFECTVEPDAQSWTCTYQSGSTPYSFGTAGGCSVGKWDGPKRQADCGFSC